MPLIKRGIDPVNLSRTHVPPGTTNELECVTNSTLANVIRQLSSLSKHAENMFCELTRDANTFFHRANQLQERVDRLKVKVTKLDSTGEEVSLQDIHMRKPFKSSTRKDQQIITLATRSDAISEVYAQCDAPPPLDKLNPYREDGKDSRKFYTDPTYFFELWCREMQKDTEHTKRELHNKRRKKLYQHHEHDHIHQSQMVNASQQPAGKRQQGPIRAAQNRMDKFEQLKHGVEFVEKKPHPPPQQQQQQPMSHYQEKGARRPDSIELSANAQYPGGQPVQPPGYNTQHYLPQGEVPPPYTSNQYNGGLRNGPVSQPQNTQGLDYQGNHVSPPSYNHNQNQTADKYEDDHSPYEGQFNNNKYEGMEPGQLQGTPPHTPSKRSTPNSSRASSVVQSPRPSAPPPAPPPVPHGLHNPPGTQSRDSLPPPPPPPPDQVTSHMAMDSARGTPLYGSSSRHIQSLRESPARHTPSPQLSGTPESMDMPPPPPPPMDHTPDTSVGMPPPPPTPPPPDPTFMSGGAGGPPAPPGPPPPPPIGGMNMAKVVNGGAQLDNVSTASNASSSTVSSGPSGKAEGVPPVRDTRCDLLAAIRTGIDLRKIEERTQKENQKKHPTTGIDVQSIMEAAFEMRRKALEANDDESDDEEVDGAWSDED